MRQGNDEAGQAIAEFIAAYEHALLVYAHLKTRYRGAWARFTESELQQPAPASMRADGAMALESQERVVSAIKRVFTLAREAGVASGAVPEEARPKPMSDTEWFILGMRMGREVSAVIGRGQTLDLRSLHTGKWT